MWPWKKKKDEYVSFQFPPPPPRKGIVIINFDYGGDSLTMKADAMTEVVIEGKRFGHIAPGESWIVKIPRKEYK